MLHHATVAGDEARGAGRGFRFAPVRQHRGCQGVLGERVQHVGQQQLLVLLLMLQAELHEACRGVREVVQQTQHRGVDMRTIGGDLGDGGPRQQATGWAGVAWTDSLIVRVEQVAEVVVEYLVTGQE